MLPNTSDPTKRRTISTPEQVRKMRRDIVRISRRSIRRYKQLRQSCVTRLLMLDEMGDQPQLLVEHHRELALIRAAIGKAKTAIASHSYRCKQRKALGRF